jgi:hypothetical protein
MDKIINKVVSVSDEFGFTKKPIRSRFLYSFEYGKGDTEEESLRDLLRSIQESARLVEDYLEATYSKPRVD